MAIKHATAADSSFSTEGDTEWERDHTIEDNTVAAAKLSASVTDVVFGRSTAGAGAGEEIAVTAAGRAILDDADAGAQRTTLGLAIGTDVQAYDAQLADIAALAVTDGNIIVGDGLNWVAESGATARTSLGLGTADSPQFTAVNVGHATDTTLARVSAGVLSVEGNTIYAAGGTDVALADGGTGASLTDPNADRLLFWDDSAGAMAFLTAGTGLTITDTTITASGSGASLDAITAAAADQAGIANADWNIRWNWAKTTNSEVAFEFGESAAATGGTSTSGVPNQVLLKLSTLAASTMSPLSVYSRALHVFSVSPTARQILLTDGSYSAPAIAFSSATAQGIYNNGSGVVIAVGSGSIEFAVTTSGISTLAGSASNPSIVGNQASNGLFFPSGAVAVASNSREIVRWKDSSSGGGWQIMDEADSDPTTTNLDSLDSVAMYNKNNKLVFAYNNGGTITYITIPLDGSTTTWTHGTTAP